MSVREPEGFNQLRLSLLLHALLQATVRVFFGLLSAPRRFPVRIQTCRSGPKDMQSRGGVICMSGLQEINMNAFAAVSSCTKPWRRGSFRNRIRAGYAPRDPPRLLDYESVSVKWALHYSINTYKLCLRAFTPPGVVWLIALVMAGVAQLSSNC